jgi:hypothetical protein
MPSVKPQRREEGFKEGRESETLYRNFFVFVREGEPEVRYG